MKSASLLRGPSHYAAKRTTEIFNSLFKNHLWQRMLKGVIATTILVILILIPGAVRAYLGKAAYLGPIISAFAFPGRRCGQMVEALILVMSGMLLGLGWSLLGIYLGSFVIETNPAAAYSIRGVFMAVALLFHGFLRSRAPRLFLFVVLVMIACIVSLTSTAKTVTAMAATGILYPSLTAAAVLFLVNIAVFPQFSSNFLGETTIETLHDAIQALQKAGSYFIQDAEGNPKEFDYLRQENGDEYKGRSANHHDIESSLGSMPPVLKSTEQIDFGDVTSQKSKLRNKLAICKAAQQECNFELAWSVLPPSDMKPISVKAMSKLVESVISLISACESKYALLGDEQRESGTDVRTAAKSEGSAGPSQEKDKLDINLVKPVREIEFADTVLLQELLYRISRPYRKLEATVKSTAEVVNVCLAHAYDALKIPSGARVPKGIALEEIDVRLQELAQAILEFDVTITHSLEGTNALQDAAAQVFDVMPRGEIFLVSSFVLNTRQAATHLQDMLRISRDLIERCQREKHRKKIYIPKLKWSWLSTGGEEQEALPSDGRKTARQGNADGDPEDDQDDLHTEGNLKTTSQAKDLESSAGILGRPLKLPGVKQGAHENIDNGGGQKIEAPSLQIRAQLADIMEWAQNSDDVLYAIKLTFASFLVLWPAFVARWNLWFSLNRGLWAAIQLILVYEVSIGNSVFILFLRSVATVLGCVWGWAAYEARSGNHIVCAVMISIGLVPATYIQLGSKYPKAGNVLIISSCVTALATELEVVPGTGTEDFLKRLIAFFTGGIVAVIVELIVFPVKARTRLVESLGSVLKRISDMEGHLAFGVEEGNNLQAFSPSMFSSFEKSSAEAKSALQAAETFLPFCSNEPRIKGSFDGLALIYGEILFVLHQIIDRMNEVVRLRLAYGSGPLEEFNAQIYPYRRNVAASITLLLYIVHEALTTKLPLPQFLPSARLAYLRLVNRVREVIRQNIEQGRGLQEAGESSRRHAVRRKFLSWNAGASALMEVIEYLEELVDLTKLLVGANEFRSGLFTRPTYRDYVEHIGTRTSENNVFEHIKRNDTKVMDEAQDQPRVLGLTKRRTGTFLRDGWDDVPASLRRIQSRKSDTIRK